MELRKQRADRKCGFTLVEVLVAAALLSVCTAMAMAGFSRVINVTVASVKSAVMHQELRNGMSRMSRDIMESNSVYDYWSGTWTFLSLYKPTAAGGVYVYYLVHDSKLYRLQSDGMGWQILGNNFESLSARFFNLDGEPVTAVASATLVNVKLGGKVSSRGIVYKDTVETRVRLRNKQG